MHEYKNKQKHFKIEGMEMGTGGSVEQKIRRLETTKRLLTPESAMNTSPEIAPPALKNHRNTGLTKEVPPMPGTVPASSSGV